jgi:acyl carrier protein
MSRDQVDAAVLAAVKEIAGRSPKAPPSVEPHHRLAGDLGLASLDVAELVAVLEMTLGVDPFAAGASIADVRTVGDLAALYQRALGT